MKKDKILYALAVSSGLIPLVVGLGIFFTWWIARACFAVAFHDLDFYGFLWIFVSLLIVSAGIIILGYLAFRSKIISSRQVRFGYFLIFFNIPAVWWVLETQADLEPLAFVRLINDSDVPISNVTITASEFTIQVNEIKPGDYEVISYEPKYVEWDDSFPRVEEVKVRWKDNLKLHAGIFPSIDKGECEWLTFSELQSIAK